MYFIGDSDPDVVAEPGVLDNPLGTVRWIRKQEFSEIDSVSISEWNHHSERYIETINPLQFEDV